jgi:hypothetical protein
MMLSSAITAALHVAGAAAVEPPVVDRAGERVDAPAPAGLDHVEMAVEMDARARATPLVARDQVDPRIAIAVAEGAFGAQIADLEAATPEAIAEQARAGAVGVARRVDGRDLNQLARQLDQRLPPLLDTRKQRLQHLRLPRRC